jgi:hypothetical protein
MAGKPYKLTEIGKWATSCLFHEIVDLAEMRKPNSVPLARVNRLAYEIREIFCEPFITFDTPTTVVFRHIEEGDIGLFQNVEYIALEEIIDCLKPPTTLAKKWPFYKLMHREHHTLGACTMFVSSTSKDVILELSANKRRLYGRARTRAELEKDPVKKAQLIREYEEIKIPPDYMDAQWVERSYEALKEDLISMRHNFTKDKLDELSRILNGADVILVEDNTDGVESGSSSVKKRHRAS